MPPDAPSGVTSAHPRCNLLGPAQVRELAARLDLRPTKALGQNFVVDANTVRRIAGLAALRPDDVVLEVGPGLGSLTLALLPHAAGLVAVEVDPRLAAQLPATLAASCPAYSPRARVLAADALTVTDLGGPSPTVLVANLPYNVGVPVLLRLLTLLPTLRQALVMVQLEVAQRLVAGPGSRVYGVPSVKAAWFGRVDLVGTVSRQVFWPVPNVDSGLVRLDRREPPAGTATREQVFACVDAAFAQRRKTLRAALAGWAGSPARAEELLRAAGVDPRTRGEQLDVAAFAGLAAAARAAGPAPASPRVNP